jgi:hypothetical protein
VHRRHERRDPGVEYEQVRTVLVDHGLGQCLVRRIARVRGESRAELVTRGPQLLFIAGDTQDAAALGYERGGNGAPEASAGTGHYGGLEGHGVLQVVWSGVVSESRPAGDRESVATNGSYEVM